MWNKITVDILIQATPGTAGGLIRLLKSLSEADYGAGSLPHITIELPHDIDVPTKRYLESFSWPPRHVQNPFDAHLLTLRHRIPSRRHDEDDMSVRFLESFWPASPELNDVVLLSPQAEVSGNWYQCELARYHSCQNLLSLITLPCRRKIHHPRKPFPGEIDIAMGQETFWHKPRAATTASRRQDCLLAA